MIEKIIGWFKPTPDFFQQQALIKQKAAPYHFLRRSKASKKGWKRRKGVNDNADKN